MKTTVIRVLFFLAMTLVGALLLSCGKNTETIRELVAAPESAPPTLVWLTYPDSAWQGRATVSFRVEADTTVSVVYLLVDGNPAPLDSLLFPSRGDTLHFALQTTALRDGYHLLILEAIRSDGFSGKSDPFPIEVRNADTTPPTVQWLYPTSGTDLTGLVGLPFKVEDNRGVASVHVYRNGIEADGDTLDGTSGNRTFEWNSDSVNDGYYTFELVAMDSAGNEGRSLTLLAHVVNQSTPRVITIPTDYNTIQAGINASKSGDTLRVLPGTYNEGLNFFGKNVWFESTDGPELTTIDATGWTWGILVDKGEDSTFTVRGFTIENAVSDGIGILNGDMKIYNSIFVNNDRYGVLDDRGRITCIFNCIFDGNGSNIAIAYDWGEVFNNVSINARTYALWNAAIYPNPISVGYNIYYNNENDFNEPSLRSSTDQFSNPLFKPGTYQLNSTSPCINSGNPSLFDLNGSRSDIGVYGGPYAYPTPN